MVQNRQFITTGAANTANTSHHVAALTILISGSSTSLTCLLFDSLNVSLPKMSKIVTYDVKLHQFECRTVAHSGDWNLNLLTAVISR